MYLIFLNIFKVETKILIIDNYSTLCHKVLQKVSFPEASWIPASSSMLKKNCIQFKKKLQARD